MGKLLGGMARLAGAFRVEVVGEGMEQLLLNHQPQASSRARKGHPKNVPRSTEPRNFAFPENILRLQ